MYVRKYVFRVVNIKLERIDKVKEKKKQKIATELEYRLPVISFYAVLLCRNLAAKTIKVTVKIHGQLVTRF